MNKHTPGPWHIDHEMYDQSGAIAFHAIIGPPTVDSAWNPIASTWGGPHERNARLIAAAPVMADLLRREPTEGHTLKWQNERRATLKEAGIES